MILGSLHDDAVAFTFLLLLTSISLLKTSWFHWTELLSFEAAVKAEVVDLPRV